MSQEKIDLFAGLSFHLLVEESTQQQARIVLGGEFTIFSTRAVMAELDSGCGSCELQNKNSHDVPLICTGLRKSGSLTAADIRYRRPSPPLDLFIDDELEKLNPLCQPHIDNNQPTPRGVKKSKK